MNDIVGKLKSEFYWLEKYLYSTLVKVCKRSVTVLVKSYKWVNSH